MTLSQSILRLLLATATLLMIPLVAMQFTTEVNWTLSDFVFAGAVLFGAGLLFVLVARNWNNTTYRLAAGVGVAAGLLLVWANAAVGLVGSEHNPANLLYGAVLAVAGIGSIAARFRPRGMARAMYAAAFTYVVVTAIALFVWTPAGNAAEPQVGLLNVLGANGAFAALWAVSGWLFQRAGAAAASPGR
ncbi:hypothetical protein GCM10023185_25900 [Hymenobacter saemangeumensis]|uniref:DUF998 domain-containing protein n=1 Tax=Hymenobacter saemangeumensis TaxID=1084522 RepID=A0ABP8IIY8_9BACT